MAKKMNAEWHRVNRMPAEPTLDERLDWHVAHDKQCGCRKMPASIVAELALRTADPSPREG